MSQRLVLSLCVTAALALTAWFALKPVSASGPLFVSPVGNDTNSCLTMSSACRTIASAVSKASAGDTIIIATGIYTETIAIDKDLTLIGFGADETIINQGRIVVYGATLRIFDLAITNGNSGTDDAGGALANHMGVVKLGYTAILSSHGDFGGGIYNYQGTLSLDHTTISGNSAIRDGGGIYNERGAVSISHSTIVSNTACNVNCLYAASRPVTETEPLTGEGSYGGGIYNNIGLMTIDASAIMSNSVVYDGGFPGDGILNYGTLRITNSTISGNAEVGLDNLSVVTLTNVTVADNVFRGLGNDGNAWLKNMIIANSPGGNNCTGSGIVSLGHNLSSDNSCALSASGDMTNTNPLLGPLQDNGGPTPTHALLSGSPAINHGGNNGCPATDQRGITRPQAGICDIGAYEFVFPYATFLPVIVRKVSKDGVHKRHARLIVAAEAHNMSSPSERANLIPSPTRTLVWVQNSVVSL